LKVAPNLNFTVIAPTKKSLDDFVQMIKNIYQNFSQAFNGHVGYGDGTNSDNIDGSWINVVAPVGANTDFTVNHNLGRIPSGYWVMQKDRACDVYTGSIGATSTQLTLRATVASAVLRLFVIGLLLGFLVTRSSAQGAAHQNIALKTITVAGSTGIGGGTVVQPIAGATITVCNGSTLPAVGSTCTGLATISQSITLSPTSSNPFNADNNGNFSFYSTAGAAYVVSIAGTGVTTYSYVWTAPVVGLGAGANAALSNLSSVSINTSLLPQTNVDLGSAANQFRNLYLFGSGIYGSNYFIDTGTPTGIRTQTKQDISDTYVYRTSNDTLLNKTLTAPSISNPAFSGSATGTSNFLPVTLLNSGTGANNTTFWRGDGTWATPSGVSVIAVNLTGQAANIGATTLTTPGANGFYRISCYIVLTQVATTSSTLPVCQGSWTDADSSVVENVTFGVNTSANTLGLLISGTPDKNPFFFAKSGTAITYLTAGYASSGATPMQYAIHIRLEGPF
jgi:hypothetical protein